jgi:Cu2+-exporting ATPase
MSPKDEERRLSDVHNARALGRPAREGDGALCYDVDLRGLHCGSCAWVIEELLRGDDAVRSARVSLTEERVRVTLTRDASRRPPLLRLLLALRGIGYGAVVRDPAGHVDAGSQDAGRTELLRLGVAAATAMNLMLLAVSLYGGDRFGMEASPRLWFRWLSLAIATPGVLWPAWPILTRAVHAVRTRQIHVDVPLAVAIVGMYLTSVWATITGVGEIWFDSLGMLVALLLGGRQVEASLRRRVAARFATMVGRREPRGRRVGTGGALDDVPASVLRVGDQVRLLRGDTVALDVRVEQGGSDIDLSVVDGESRPRRIDAGQVLPAGARVLDGVLDAVIVADAGGSLPGRLRAAVREALDRRQPEELLADRIARAFVVLVLVLAALALYLHIGEGAARALEVSTAVLVVACPCALALATPLVFAASVHGALARGALLRDGGVLLAAARASRVAFDRTGTLTEGRLRPGDLVLDPRGPFVDGDEVLRLAGAVCATSHHPVARAVHALAVARVGSLPEAKDVREVAGSHVEGTVLGRHVRVGRPGATVQIDGSPAGHVPLADLPRGESAGAIASLRGLGLPVAFLSGDVDARTQALARSLGIPDARGELRPEDKARWVRERVRAGERVVFVGDGLNDGPALAEATVALAMGHGVDLALEAAHGVILENDPRVVPELVALGRRARFVLVSNVVISATYNGIAVLLAVLGYVTPLLAAGLMPISSLVVLGRAAWLARAPRGA